MIIQAMSTASYCIIHIIDSDIDKTDGTIFTPVLCQQ